MFSVGGQRVTNTGGGSELPAPGSVPGSYPANHAAIQYTDCVTPTFVSGWARFQRPINDAGSDYQYAMPGARMRFSSNAPSASVDLRWNGLITRTDARNLIGHIYVDGVRYGDFQTPSPVNTVTQSTVFINMGTSATRLYEIILPYADGVEFGQVKVDPAYTVTSPSSRTGQLMVCLGDSITQGFKASDLRRTWPFLLASAKGFRCLNMGYGGRVTVPSDGTIVAGLSPDLITVLLGTNDYLNQVDTATYKANLKQLLINIHAVNSSVPIYLSAPIPTTVSKPIPFSSYEPIAGQVKTELAYAQIVGVSNGSLITNTATQLDADGIHPNDAGHAQMAAGWGAVM